MSSCFHVDDNGNDILILRKGATLGLGEHSLTAEKCIHLIFADNGDKYCLSLHYNASSYLSINGKKLLNLKQKILRL